MSRLSTIAALALTASVAGVLAIPPASAADTAGAISGVTFEDANRNGVRDVGEQAMADHVVYLFDQGGAYAGQATTDADGRYALTGLAVGTYRVEYAATTWWRLRDTWTPTTTGTLRPQQAVNVTGPTTVDFGWRPVIRSRVLGSPVSAFTGPSGLRVESYNDAVTARQVHDAVTAGAVGAEAPYVLIRFDYSDTSVTSAGWQGQPGAYSSYNAVCYDNWITWVEQGDWGVSHEYGHAWSRYFDTVVQQDGALAGYLRARGLAGDPRVGSSYGWNPDELIAEDYRQLLGSPTARQLPQANRDIPAAAAVSGLREFLTTTFQQATSGAPVAAPAPAPALAVTDPVVGPAPVKTSATVSSTLSRPATVSVEIRDSRGALVRTLLGASASSAGPLQVWWDRKTSTSKRAAAGTYTAVVRASDGGVTVTGSTPFRVA